MTELNEQDRETIDGPPRSGRASSESLAFVPGSIIAGKYIVERELAAGGSGVIVLATHLELGQQVAIKYLRPGRLAQPMVLERFKREARLAASIRCEHVVRIYDVGTLEDGAPYMVMEYLVGEDLSAFLTRQGPLAVDHAVRLTLEACIALQEAHGLGIIHRDLKPANLFLAQRPNAPPVVKIVDFGISKLASAVRGVSGFPKSGSSDQTGRFERFGTPYYMSPEQVMSSTSVDPRSDIWAIGVVLYELLTARLPFEGADLRQIVASVLSSPPIPLRERRFDVPLELERVVHACLAYHPADRPRDVAELVERLTPFGAAELPPATRSLEVEVSGVYDLGWVSAEPAPAKWHPSYALLAAVGGLSIVVGASAVVAAALWTPATMAPAPASRAAITAPEPVTAKHVARSDRAPAIASAPGPVVGAPAIASVAVDAGNTAVQARPRPAAAAPKANPVVAIPGDEATNDFGDRR